MKYIISILFSVLTLTSFAQNTVLISGLVKDIDYSPIEGATIRVLNSDSVFLVGAISGTDGNFALKMPITEGIIQITCLGYQSQYKTISVNNPQEKLFIGTIILQSESINLDEIMITGQASAMQMKGDTLEYNTSIYTLPERASVRDLLKLLPNVTITDKGEILVQGKAVSKILVDGKEFFSSDPEMASNSLPGKIVNKVQVVEQSSEAARLTGFETGDKETVLNLSIKEENKVGTMVQASAGGGHDINGDKVRYEQNAYVNLLKKKDIYNLTLRNDNTNNSTGSSQTGDNSISRIGLSVTKQFGERLNIFGDVTYHSMKLVENMYTDRQTIFTPESFLYDKLNNFADSRNKNLNAGVTTEWNPNKNHTLVVRTFLTHLKSNNNGNDLFASFNNTGDTLYHGHTNTEGGGKNYSLDINMDYAYRLKKKGRVLSTSLYGMINHSNSQDSYFWNRQIYENNKFQRDSLVNQQAIGKISGRQFKLFLSYVEPIMEHRFVQLAYTVFLMDNHSDKNTYDVLDEIFPDIYQLLPALSPYSRKKGVNQRFTLNYRSSTEKNEYMMGLNVDFDNSENETCFPDESFRSNVNQKVTNYSPVLNIKHRFNKSTTLRFDYEGTMTSPTNSQLQDYTDTSDPTNSIKGNPNLKPEFTNRASLNFSGSNSQTGAFYDSSIYGKYTTNAIQSVYDINPETGNKVTSYKNINGSWNIYFNCTYYTPIKKTHFTVGNVFKSEYVKNKGFLNGEISTMDSYVIDERPNLKYYTPDLNFRIQGIYRYMAIKGQTVTDGSMNTHDFGAQLEISYLLPYKIRINPSFRWSFKKGYEETGDVREKILDVIIERDCFSKKYGTGTIKLSGFDLLQSRKQLARIVGSSYVQNTISSTMGSYFMCSFIYSFDFFP